MKEGMFAAKAGIPVAILAAFLAVGFTSYDEKAVGGSFPGSNWHYGGACDSWAGTSKGDATCLSADGDNSPPYSFPSVGGSTYWVRNECSEYGAVKAQIDVKLEIDEHTHLGDSSTWEGSHSTAKIRQTSCCIDASALCWQDPVEPKTSGHHTGWIRFVTIEGTSISHGAADVRTHENRYNFCQQYSNTIDCPTNPEDDAFTDPRTVAPEPQETVAQLDPNYREYR